MKPQPVSVTMGDFPTTYESDAKKAFKGPPADFQKQKAVRAKCDSNKGSFNLGEARNEYMTASQQHFAKMQDRPQKISPAYTNYNQSVDVITGAVKDKNQKSYGFERWTDNNQHMRSSNQTVFPQDKFIHDPIGHRNIMRKQL